MHILSGAGLSYERGGDALRKFSIKPGHGPNFFDLLKETIFKIRPQANEIYNNFSHATLNETFTAKYNGVLPRTP